MGGDETWSGGGEEIVRRKLRGGGGWVRSMVVEGRSEEKCIVDRLDPVKRSIFEVGRRTRRKVIPAAGDGGRTWEGRERGEVVCVCV
ncbi:hypothetical protein Tco_0804220 [Tanacetum coccineum]|uniref:Uncharacterized protein n=1 Tax=Tanacetum coccineum TaxID=301880 RepID=A0ABQ5A7J1_9ASTR